MGTPHPTLELVRAGDTERHYLTCRDDTTLAPVVCDSTSFEVHYFKGQKIEIVCTACGQVYGLDDLVNMQDHYPEDQ
jgi:hypothetical protein